MTIMNKSIQENLVINSLFLKIIVKLTGKQLFLKINFITFQHSFQFWGSFFFGSVFYSFDSCDQTCHQLMLFFFGMTANDAASEHREMKQ